MIYRTRNFFSFTFPNLIQTIWDQCFLKSGLWVGLRWARKLSAPSQHRFSAYAVLSKLTFSSMLLKLLAGKMFVLYKQCTVYWLSDTRSGELIVNLDYDDQIHVLLANPGEKHHLKYKTNQIINILSFLISEVKVIDNSHYHLGYFKNI